MARKIKIPSKEELRISELERQNTDLMLVLAESAEIQQQDKINNQLAVAELVETLMAKGLFNGAALLRFN